MLLTTYIMSGQAHVMEFEHGPDLLETWSQARTCLVWIWPWSLNIF